MSDLVSSDQAPYYKVKQCLRSMGASPYILSRPEVEKLALLLQDNERIEAFICGTYIAGWGMLVATERKLIFIEKQFVRLKVEELPYQMISAIDHSTGRKYGKVTVRAQRKDYYFRRVNRDCVKKFISYVESRMYKDKEVPMEVLTEVQNLDPRFNYSSNFHIPTSTT